MTAEETITHRRIRELMEHYGVTKFRLGIMAGVSETFLRTFFSKPQQRMRPLSLQALAKVLQCTPEYLAGDSDEISLGPPGSLEYNGKTVTVDTASTGTVDERIKFHRNRLAFTQQRIADQLGVTKAMVSAWETGLSTPSRERLEQLSKIFDVDFLTFETDTEFVKAQEIAKRDAQRHHQPRTQSAGRKIELSMRGEMAHIAVEATVPWEIGLKIAEMIREHAVPKP